MGRIIISVAKDFSLHPGPRYIDEGKYSGELFRTTIIEPKFKEALENGQTLVVNLDGTFGYGTSFLEETFGGLARIYMNQDYLSHIEIISEEEPYLKDDINEYISDALAGKKWED